MITAKDREEIKRIVLETSVKISQLEETGTVNASDFINVIRSNNNTYQSRRITIENLLKAAREKYPSSDGAKLKGVARPNDEAFTPDQTTDTFWFAFEPGEYPAYGNMVVEETPKIFIYRLNESDWEEETLWDTPNSKIPFLFHQSTLAETEVVTDNIGVTPGNTYNIEMNVLSTGTYDTFRIDEYSYDFQKLRSYEKRGNYFSIIPGEGTLYFTITVVENPSNPVDLDGSFAFIVAPTSSLVGDSYKYLSILSNILEDAFVEAEAARVEAENQRVAAETNRVNAESARQTAEESRISAETARANAESGRSSAESERVSAETARNDAETARASAESGRVSAENNRVTAESNRVSAETARANAESSRVNAESTRVTAENSRISAENARVSAENARVSAETTRHTQFNADHSASVAATNAANIAAEAADEAREGIQDDLARKANTDGWYGGMTVGSAENLVGRGSVDAEYGGIRTSAGTADIGSGSATIQKMKGRSFVWNQLVKNGNFADGIASWGRNGVNILASDNVLTAIVVESASMTNVGIQQSNVPFVVNHKFFMHGWIKTNDNSSGQCFIGFGSNADSAVKVTATNDEWKEVIGIRSTANNREPILIVGQLNARYGVVLNIKNIICLDLTLIFGPGNEPSTVEEFDAWRKEMGLTLDYYDYNEGEVINNKAQAIETVGFNLYDPATGKAFLPGPYSNYPQEYEICGTFTSISFTDVNGNTSVPTLTDGRFFNVDAPGELTVVGGNNTDTLVHLVWSGWRNYGEPDYAFEPYWKNTLNLNLTQLTGKLNGAGESVVVFPNGLAKVGSVQDEIVGNKAIKRIGVVDLGTLTWNLQSTFNCFYRAFPEVKSDSGANMLCAKYKKGAINYGNFIRDNDDIVTVGSASAFSGTIVVKDTDYSDAATFKTAMSGVLLYYELATPEEYLLDEPLPSQYHVDDFGTERVVPSYSQSLTAPISYDVQYAMNAVDAIRRLPDNYVERTDVKQAPGQSEEFVLSQKAVNDNYAKKVGVENDLVVGAAKALAGNQRINAEFTTAVMSGADGVAKINEVKGKSLVWNQYLKGLSSENWRAGSGNVSSLVFEDGVATFTTLDSGTNRDVRQIDSVRLVSGHKYYYSFYAKSDIDIQLTFYGYLSGVNTQITNIFNVGEHYTKCSAISTASNTNDFSIRITEPIAYGATTISVKNVFLIDLTLMFGAGNEPATVEEFEKLFPAEYYEYNAGEIISNTTESLEIRDAEEELKATMPMNLSTITGKLNGEGESVVIFPDGMRSAGTAHDYLIVDEGGYARKAVKVMESVDMDSFSYDMISSGLFQSRVPGRAYATNSYNMLAQKYVTYTQNNSSAGNIESLASDKDRMLFVNGGSQTFFVKDSAYTDATTFKTAMSGVELIYELATTLTYDLDEPIQMTFMAYHGGTITQTPQAPDSAPMALNMTYALDAASTLNGLPQDYISAESIDGFLAVLSTQMGGIWTRTYNATTDKHEFTFTTNNNG